MHLIDWIIVAAVFAGLALVGIYTKRAGSSVADFLAANRCGRRYLLTMAEGMSTLGAISIVMYFEQYYNSGFINCWWGQMQMPIGLIIFLSGWVVYRYRSTRVMTMAQFFELRYSKRFRVFTGVVSWASGIINFGVFPAVGARIFIYLTGMPVYTYPLGPIELNLTLGVVMFVLLTVALFLTFSGGQITVMVTDFLQGQFTNVVLLGIMIFVFIKFGWGDIIEGIQYVPEGESMINPFTEKTPDFSFPYYAIVAFGAFYGCMAWQGGQGYNCAAKSPHEARMSKILGAFRGGCFTVMVVLLPLIVFTVMRHPKYSSDSAAIQQTLSQISDSQIQTQQTTAIGLSHLMPTGIIGLLAAVIAAAAISTNDTYLHSWGSIFVQDVILPFRKQRLSPEQHIKYLRRSIFGVAAFAWLFSMLFPLKEYIAMFFQITGAIYVGGAGAAIIGGLYWKRGTTAGAWAGMITGSTLAVGSVLISNIFWPFILPALQSAYPNSQYLQGLDPEKFPINGAFMGFYASIAAVIVYVLVSLLSGKKAFDMDRLLHRGKYAIEGEHVEQRIKVSFWSRVFGMGKEFTRGDRVIYILVLCWSCFWFLTFLIGTLYHLFIKPFPDEAWIKWWLFWVIIMGVTGILSTTWFLIGGFINLKQMFGDLRTVKRDELDDGTVETDIDT